MTFQKDAKTETQTLEALLRAGTTTSKGIFFCENNLDNLTGFYWGRLNRVGGWVVDRGLGLGLNVNHLTEC